MHKHPCYTFMIISLMLAICFQQILNLLCLNPNIGGRSIGVLRLSINVINFLRNSNSSLVFFWRRIASKSFFIPFLDVICYWKEHENTISQTVVLHLLYDNVYLRNNISTFGADIDTEVDVDDSELASDSAGEPVRVFRTTFFRFLGRPFSLGAIKYQNV